jgi:outer membrane protein assembly factor BamB
MSGVNSDATQHEPRQNDPRQYRINRRRLLLSAAGGLGALTVSAGAGWWARRDPAHGPRIWSTTAPGRQIVLPAESQASLYVSGYDGRVSALDPRTGAVRWSKAVSTPEIADTPSGLPLAVGDGVVCVTTPTRVHVLAAESGEARWEVPVPDWRDVPWEQGPAVGSGGVLAPYGTTLRSYDVADGSLRWSGPPNSSGVPVVAGDTVYTPGRPTGLRAFDIHSGEQRWEQNAVRAVQVKGGPAVRQGVAYLADCDGPEMRNPAVLALDATTGRVRWRRAQPRMLTSCPPVVTDGTVCLLSGNTLTVLDADTGDTRWTATTPVGLGRGESSMTAADGTAYVGTNDDRLYAYDLATGRLRWQDEPEHLRSDTEFTRISLAATGTAVYRASRTGVHALGAVPSA